MNHSPKKLNQLNRALLQIIMSKDAADIVADRLEELERENAALRQDKERLITILKDLVDVAKFAMFQANNDGAEWDVESELSDARAAIDAARKEQP